MFVASMEWVGRILLAGICGYLVGFERSNRNKEAGVRTHFIVAMSAALMMVVSKYGFYDSGKFDASRVAAQIVTGIGFLGAGIIFVKNNTFVRGLTTAAGVWATAGIGMCIGAGLLLVGIISTGIILAAQFLFHLDRFGKDGVRESLHLTMKRGQENVVYLFHVMEIYKVHVEEFHCTNGDHGKTQVEMEIVCPMTLEREKMIGQLLKNEEVETVDFLK